MKQIFKKNGEKWDEVPRLPGARPTRRLLRSVADGAPAILAERDISVRAVIAAAKGAEFADSVSIYKGDRRGEFDVYAVIRKTVPRRCKKSLRAILSDMTKKYKFTDEEIEPIRAIAEAVYKNKTK